MAGLFRSANVLSFGSIVRLQGGNLHHSCRTKFRPCMVVTSSGVASISCVAASSTAFEEMKVPILSHNAPVPSFIGNRTREIHTSTPSRAGHNKWSNIKTGKAKIDQARSRMITKLSKKLPVAIKVGGGSIDPKLNRNVADVLKEMSKNNIPKSTIERVLTNALNKVNKPPIKVEFDIKGPSGSFFIVQMECESKKKAEQNLKRYMNKIEQFSMTSGGIRAYFEEKGVVEVCGSPDSSSDTPSTPLSNLEEAENIAIEIGAEEVFESKSADDSVAYQFMCDPKRVSIIQSALSSRGYEVTEAELELRPLVPVLLGPTDNELIAKFYEKLDEDEEISKVFDNLAA